MAEALEGIRILDLTRLLPGPYCSMLLADLGADVLKIEEPLQGDTMRLRKPFLKKESMQYLILNRNKKSLTLRKTFMTKTRDEWIKILRGANVCCAPVYDVGEAFSDPHSLLRDMVIEVEHPTEGRIKQLGFPWKFSD